MQFYLYLLIARCLSFGLLLNIWINGFCKVYAKKFHFIFFQDNTYTTVFTITLIQYRFATVTNSYIQRLDPYNYLPVYPFVLMLLVHSSCIGSRRWPSVIAPHLSLTPTPPSIINLFDRYRHRTTITNHKSPIDGKYLLDQSDFMTLARERDQDISKEKLTGYISEILSQRGHGHSRLLACKSRLQPTVGTLYYITSSATSIPKSVSFAH